MESLPFKNDPIVIFRSKKDSLICLFIYFIKLSENLFPAAVNTFKTNPLIYIPSKSRIFTFFQLNLFFRMGVVILFSAAFFSGFVITRCFGL